MNKAADNSNLSVKEKIGYGMGDMASNFYMGFFGIFLLYYYTDVYGIAPAAIATMFLATKIIDAISDPMMGLIADRTETRWGKYRPYLIWMVLPYAALGYLLFLGPELSDSGKLIFAYVSYSLVMLVYTAINVPYSGLMAVIHPESSERTKAAQYRFIFASLGTLAVGASAKPLVAMFGGGDELVGFRSTIILFAVLSIAIFVLTFVTTKERIRPKKHDSSVKQDMGVLLKNKSWIVLAITGIFVVVGLIARLSSVAHFAKYNMSLDDAVKYLWWMDGATLIITCGLLGQLIGATVTPWLVDRFEKHHLMIFFNLLHTVSLAVCYFVPAEHYALTLILHSIGIFTFGIVITLLFTMYTDCAEYGDWVSGHHSAGLTVSASLFSLKCGSAVGTAIPAYVLAYVGYIANQAQSPEALEGIRVMFNFLPAFFFFVAAILMLFYKIDRSLLAQIEVDLKARRVGVD